MNRQDAHPDRRAPLLKRLLKEPLLQFLALGGLIFLGAFLFDSGGTNDDTRIVVGQRTVDRLALLYEKQMGAPPAPDQLQRLVDNHIREEILFREARRLRLDANDEIVRRRLAQKMEFLAARSVDEPSEDDLRAYYETHAEAFRQPPRVSFTHLYFSPDTDGAESAEARARETLKMLHAECPVVEGVGQGDPFPLQSEYARLSPRDAVQLFGSTDIADGLFEAPVGVWSGPYASGYGWHVVQISRRTDASVPPFDNVRSEVLAAYQRDSAARRTQEAIDDMAARYEIVRPAPGSAP